MSYEKKKSLEIHTKGNIKRWSEWDGSWNSYLAHLDEGGALSPNFILHSDGVYRLREGYNPPWTLKDFK